MIEILFENSTLKSPLVSIILLDWSVRESYHIFHYLNNQTIPREQYEIIWIEYYDKRANEIDVMLNESKNSGKLPIIDKWILMQMPGNIYYHKHLMYNTGIIAGKGRIITFMDSDAIVMPTFIESIIRSFEKDRNIVLHMDQVRSMNKRFYPFNYPTIAELIERGHTNLLNGKPVGLVDKSDPLHLKNYGSCMSALRDDLIAIGGADEHIDYLGHICGPYDMTFRLVNSWKKEIWHSNEWLYHTWHPGQAGDKNFSGPHDGRHMSTTALEVRWTGRILPLVENSSIRILRLGQADRMSDNPPLSQVIDTEEIKNWTINEREFGVRKYRLGSKAIEMKVRGEIRHGPRLKFLTRFFIWKILFKLHLNQKFILMKTTFRNDIKYAMNLIKGRKATADSDTSSGISSEETSEGIKNKFIIKVRRAIISNRFLKPVLAWYRIFFRIRDGIVYRIRFIRGIATSGYNKFIADECWRNLYRLSKENNEVAVFGVGSITEIVLALTRDVPIRMITICDDIKRKKFSGVDVKSVESLRGYKGKVMIASVFGIDERAETLRGFGISDKNIIRLF